MADKVVAHPLITIANIIWSFNPLTHLPQVLLVKRAYPPFEGHWALPETLLWRDESADAACIRLIKDKIGVRLSNSATEQLATFTDPDRVSRGRALAIAYMTFLPTMPQLRAGYGATEVGWFSLNFDHGTILQILGPTFTLRQAREVYATFRQTTVDQIDNSNFKKTHQKLFKEVGTAATKRSGRPPKLFKLVLPCV